MIILNVVTRIEFDALKENVKIYQDNIDKNITWFYAALAIVVTVLIVGLIVVVRASISRGIQKGVQDAFYKIEKQINEQRDFLYASGNTSVSAEHGNLLQVYGLTNLSIYNFVSLTIINRHGRVMEYHSLDIKAKNDIRGFDVKIVDYNKSRDGMTLFFNVVWRNDNSYEEMLNQQKNEKILV